MSDFSTPAVTTGSDIQPRLNRRQAAKVRTRQKVLDAARALFAERGYDAATIRDIAREAGMSTGAVFANFQDKAELFETVFGEEMTGLAQDFRTGADFDGPVAKRLTGAMDAGYHRSLAHLPLMQAMIARSWFQPADVDLRSRAFIKPVIETLAGILQDGVRSGELQQDVETLMVARLLWDIWMSNFRFVAYDGWDAAALSAHIGKQTAMLLAGQTTTR
ncbi:TetR family transcriptional regulator [Rhizobium sp. CRIBSB]|nr:TetR family transcriptional regulator [Rhizobium sp. CRIBSB]